MSGIQIGSDIELEIKVRANNMAKITGRLMQGLGSPDANVQLAMTWISRQNISKVEGIQYSSGRSVGYFEINIDWDKSRLVVEGPDYRRTLPLTSSCLVEEQVKKQLREVIQYFEAKRCDLKVDYVKVIYSTAPGEPKPEGFYPLPKEEVDELRNIRCKRDKGVRVNPGEYPEMGIGYFEL